MVCIGSTIFASWELFGLALAILSAISSFKFHNDMEFSYYQITVECFTVNNQFLCKLSEAIIYYGLLNDLGQEGGRMVTCQTSMLMDLVSNPALAPKVNSAFAR